MLKVNIIIKPFSNTNNHHGGKPWAFKYQKMVVFFNYFTVSKCFIF